MIEVIACIVSLASLGLSLVLARRVWELEARLRQTERPASSPGKLPEPSGPSKLEGLRIAIAVTQDYPHPVFANLLKEQFLREDVSDVVFLNPEEAERLEAEWKDFDLLIKGSLVGNGYAEVFYDADLACRNAHETICNLVERPPHGDRPSNLALEMVTRVSRDLDKLLSRNERREAIRELRGPGS